MSEDIRHLSYKPVICVSSGWKEVEGVCPLHGSTGCLMHSDAALRAIADATRINMISYVERVLGAQDSD